MLRVTVDMFSGRPNPSWDVPAAAAAEILTAIAANRGMISTGSGPSILGFRGLILTLSDDVTASTYGLPKAFRLGDGLAQDVSASSSMAAMLLNAAPEPLAGLTADLRPLIEVPPGLAPEAPPPEAPEATGQRDAWPNNAATVPDGSCRVEVGGYSPVFWNSPTYIRENNNCYAYGCDMRTSTFPQPGRYSGQTLQPTLASVIACALADGAVKQGVCMPTARQPRWLMALVTTPDNIRDWDYHWYRKQMEPYWGHKPGKTLVTNRDSSGNIITDPQTCNRGIYTVWGGYFYAPATMNIS